MGDSIIRSLQLPHPPPSPVQPHFHPLLPASALPAWLVSQGVHNHPLVLPRTGISGVEAQPLGNNPPLGEVYGNSHSRIPIEVGRNTWRIRKSFFTKHEPLSNPRSQYHTFCKTIALMIWCHTRQYSPPDVLHSSHYLFCLTRVDIERRNYLLITPGGGGKGTESRLLSFFLRYETLLSKEASGECCVKF